MKKLAVLLLLIGTACIETEPSALSESLLDCEFGRAQSLPVGGVLRDTAGGARYCVEAGEGGTFAVVPFIAGARDTAARVTVSIFGAGLTAGPSLQDLQTAPRTRPLATTELDRLLRASAAWHDAFRVREDAELATLRQRPLPARSTIAAPRTRAAAVPVPGDVIQLNVSASCDRLDRRSARVVAVTNQAIVAWDPANPVRGRTFSDDDLREFGQEFDQTIHSLITQNFGTASDLDQNGRVILYFTRAVNEIAIPGNPAALAIGFFYRGDVLPRAGIPDRAPPCANSNEGEVLYLAVPDSLGEVRGVPVSYGPLEQVMSGTIAHEFQHLINAARRVHVTNASNFEEPWLNEGLSHIAEELMFYATSDLTPGQNIDTTAIYASNLRKRAFSRFAYKNLGQFNVFIRSTRDASLMGPDGFATRGAIWSFLRYAADRDSRSDVTLFRALSDGPGIGIENLRAALGTDPLPWIQDWSVSVIADDLVPGLDPRYRQPSWNLRSLITANNIPPHYPLEVLPVLPGSVGFSMRLRTGGVAYPVFAVKPGERAFVTISADGETSDRKLQTILMRLK